MGAFCGLSLREIGDRVSDRCLRFVPCQYDPGRRCSVCLKIILVTLHLVCIVLLFACDKELIAKTKREPWYTLIYLLLFVAALVQYFLTANSSPGYVLDAMRVVNESDASQRKKSTTSKQPASSNNGSTVITVERDLHGRSLLGKDAWTKLVMDMYPPGSSVRISTCPYCNILQPPRAKHCYDCDKCVLQFDHHCLWLGTCIGQGNHFRFWWYLCTETALCIWTAVLFITYLKDTVKRSWWIDLSVILLLIMLAISFAFLMLLLVFHGYLILTNQTTYELVRQRRISYLRDVPERVYPFSKGICRNVFDFCCRRSLYELDRLPTRQELEEMSRPRTCGDVMSCRCC